MNVNIAMQNACEALSNMPTTAPGPKISGQMEHAVTQVGQQSLPDIDQQLLQQLEKHIHTATQQMKGGDAQKQAGGVVNSLQASLKKLREKIHQARTDPRESGEGLRFRAEKPESGHSGR